MVVARLGRALHNRRAIDRILVLIRAIAIIILLVVAPSCLILFTMVVIMHRRTVEPLRDWWLVIIDRPCATIALFVVMMEGGRWEQNGAMVVVILL